MGVQLCESADTTVTAEPDPQTMAGTLRKTDREEGAHASDRTATCLWWI